MRELNDHELLAEFSRNESEAAFAALVVRHVNLVHAAALRFTSNPHHAEDITQAVFVILARKAGKLPARTVVPGWLYQATRLAAANFMKGEIRRHKREQEACIQSALTTPPEPPGWERIAPLLDEAMGRLGETDRNAIVLRFFENKTVRETGAALKMTEAAARKRVDRALEKLRKIFTKRGVAMPAALIAGAVTSGSVQPARAGLAAAVASAAAGKTSFSAAITTLVKGTMKKMTLLKLKFTAGVCLAVFIALLVIGFEFFPALAQPPGADGGRSMFPEPMPVADANPAITSSLALKVPTKLIIERTPDTLSVSVDDQKNIEAVKLDAGSKMIVGVQFELFVYPEGEARPATERSSGLGGPDFNLGTRTLNAKQDGIPAKGVKYVVEMDLVVFETDVPPQHMWSPAGSKKYKVLLRRTLKQIVPP